MKPIEGGCLCGAIRYTSKAQPLVTAVCNCRHCQRQTGTSFSILLGLPKGSLELTGDTPATFHDTGTSGLPVQRRFCARCGSPILSEVTATPTIDWLKAGTLDDPSWLQPQISIWCDSAQPWVQMPEGVARFPQNPPPGG